MNGLYIKINKNIIFNNNKYKIILDKNILSINDLLSLNYKGFINDKTNPYIEISKNPIIEKIYKNNDKYIILRFMSINDNNYPKIHILPWIKI